jgi:hypothetical protein
MLKSLRVEGRRLSAVQEAQSSEQTSQNGLRVVDVGELALHSPRSRSRRHNRGSLAARAAAAVTFGAGALTAACGAQPTEAAPAPSSPAVAGSVAPAPASTTPKVEVPPPNGEVNPNVPAAGRLCSLLVQYKREFLGKIGLDASDFPLVDSIQTPTPDIKASCRFAISAHPYADNVTVLLVKDKATKGNSTPFTFTGSHSQDYKQAGQPFDAGDNRGYIDPEGQVALVTHGDEDVVISRGIPGSMSPEIQGAFESLATQIADLVFSKDTQVLAAG